MARWAVVLLLAWAASLAAQPPEKKPPQDLQKQRPKSTKEAIPPEEDKALAPTEYSFNPLQAQKEVETGIYYFKKGSYRAAAGRFREATRWNDGNAQAWLRLGEVEEKLKDPKSAKEAYAKYLELASDAKNAADIRKKIDKLK